MKRKMVLCEVIYNKFINSHLKFHLRLQFHSDSRSLFIFLLSLLLIFWLITIIELSYCSKYLFRHSIVLTLTYYLSIWQCSSCTSVIAILVTSCSVISIIRSSNRSHFMRILNNNGNINDRKSKMPCGATMVLKKYINNHMQ